MAQWKRSNLFLFFIAACAVLNLSSCSTAKKERLEQREKLSGSSGIFCDFINGEKYNDVEVVMNLEMAKKCDSAKPFSISGYKSAAEVPGMMYCCAMSKKAEVAAAKASSSSSPGPGSPASSKSSGPSLTPSAPATGAPAAKPATTPSTNNSKDPLLDEVIAE